MSHSAPKQVLKLLFRRAHQSARRVVANYDETEISFDAVLRDQGNRKLQLKSYFMPTFSRYAHTYSRIISVNMQ